MFTEPELVVRRAGHSFRYLEGNGKPLGGAVFQRDHDRQQAYSSNYTIRNANHELLLIAWRLRQPSSFQGLVLSHFVLCDEGGNTIAGIDALRTSSVHSVVTAHGEPFGELKSRSRRTASSFIIGDADGREIASIKSASLYAGRRYHMTRHGPLPLLWQRITTFLCLMPVLYPPPPLGSRAPSATYPL